VQPRKLAKALNGAGVAVFAWAWLFPHPYPALVALLAVCPWLAVILVFRSAGRYRILARRKDPHPGLGALVLLPGLALAILAIDYVHLIDWEPALGAAAIGGLAFTFVLAIVDPTLRERRAMLVFLLLLMGAYAYGAAVQADALLDAAPAKLIAVPVVGKWDFYGRYVRSSYIQLAPWGPRREVSDVSVRRVLYDFVKIGGTVCLHLRPGALWMAWYYVTPCLTQP
jgi:hypothetical protein